MKVIIFVQIFVAIFSATEGIEFNWTDVKPAWQQPEYKKIFEAIYPNQTEDIKLPTSRIYGGWEAQKHQFPYMVANTFLTFNGWYFCGGSLVSQHFVLTAAHCTDRALLFQFIFGAHYLYQPIGTEQTADVLGSNKIVHPNWNPQTLHNDIALVRLNRPVIQNNYVKLVRLPCFSQAGNSYARYIANISGWGRTENGLMANALRYTQNPLLEQAVCQASIKVWPELICLSGANGRGACDGDSGDPLVVLSNGYLQVGVLSFAVNGCGSLFPQGASRITSYLNWLNRYVAICP